MDKLHTQKEIASIERGDSKDIAEESRKLAEELLDIFLDARRALGPRELDTGTKARLFDELIDGLREAACVYRDGKDGGRAGIKKMLVAVAWLTYFAGFETDDDITSPIRALLSAFTDLESGRSPVLFKVAKRKEGRQANSDNRETTLALSVAVADLLREADLVQNQKEADELVAKTLNEEDLRHRGGLARDPKRGLGEITWRTIHGWRENIQSGDGQYEGQKQVHAAFVTFARRALENAESPEKRFKLIQCVKEFCRGYRSADDNPKIEK